MANEIEHFDVAFPNGSSVNCFMHMHRFPVNGIALMLLLYPSLQ